MFVLSNSLHFNSFIIIILKSPQSSLAKWEKNPKIFFSWCYTLQFCNLLALYELFIFHIQISWKFNIKSIGLCTKPHIILSFLKLSQLFTLDVFYLFHKILTYKLLLIFQKDLTQEVYYQVFKFSRKGLPNCKLS